MKKLILFAAASCAFSFAIAQDSLQNNNYFSCTVGKSFPLGDFRSANIDKINTGVAKDGWSFELTYAHQLDELFGFSSAFVYAQFPVKKIPENETAAASIKPLEYYELLIGPMMSGSIGKKISLDLSVLTGTAFINATKVNLNGEMLPKKFPASAIPLRCAFDLKFQLATRWYFAAGIDYNYMRASMNVTIQSQDISYKQSLNSASINCGLGFSF